MNNKELLDLMFGTFPREFSRKRKYITSEYEFIDLVNKYNGFIDCYASIYGWNKEKVHSVDKIFFDMDNLEMTDGIYYLKLGKKIAQPRCYMACRSLHYYLDAENIKHIVLFSGKGFHIYVFIDEGCNIYNKKSMIKNIQHHLAKEANITIGHPQEADIDDHIVGDIRRIARIPFTFNLKQKRFCIPLDRDDFALTYDEIREKAKNQFNNWTIFGEVYLDPREYDVPTNIEGLEALDDFDIGENVDFKEMIKMLPPLIQKLILSSRCGWRDRYLTILAMREVGFPKQLCIQIVREYWTPEKFKHSLMEERQVDYIYNGRPDLFFPNWDLLISEGYPISKKDKDFKFYKKR